VNQLHANGIAHCDICIGNIFVEFEEDGGAVFLGGVEYCCALNCSAPTNLQRSDTNALTAEDLDFIQLEKLKDELASL
jgi:predicted unusual protein kinase regulating ubiquinone biosynthesis (AarF/ABC1/UbiB family)